jgi:large subunit ribosomal protein L2
VIRQIPATVKIWWYDPNRSARIALVYYADGEKDILLLQTELKLVKQFYLKRCGPEIETHFSYQMSLGTSIHNIELYPSQGVASEVLVAMQL